MAERAMPYPEAARRLLRDTLLDAMRDRLGERPWASISMGEVATAAGVSRQTLYKEFGTRREFAQAFVLREADRFLSAVERPISEHAADPAAALTAALDVFLAAAADDPFVRAITSGQDADELLPLLTVRGRPLFVHASERLAAVLLDNWPDVERADAELLADCVVRLAVSHATAPVDDPRRTAADLSRLLEPFVERALARSGALRR